MEYTRTAKISQEYEAYGGVCIGNETITENNDGYADTGEPFNIMYSAQAGINLIQTKETKETHTITIYKGVPGEDSGEPIFSGEALAFSAAEDWGGRYVHEINAADKVFVLIEGNTYTVNWDGEQHVCVGKQLSINGITGVGIGNYGLVGAGDDTGEPFVVGHITHFDDGTNSLDMNANVFMASDTAETHSVDVYEGVLEEDSGEEVGKVILENRTVAYSADDGCWIAMNDEGTGPYLTDGVFSLTEGKTYTIVINGVEYVGEASKATVEGLGEVIGIGNGDALAGGEGNGEPYAAGFAQAGANASTFVFFWFDTDTRADTYTVSLYEGDITSGGGGTEDGYLLKDAELAFELETNSETVYYNNEVAVTLSVGKTYTVIWDGSYYDCTAKEYTEDSLTAVVLGNLNIQDNTAENTGEPFLYLYVNVEGNAAANFKTLETDASHVISIYDGVLEHPAVTYADIYTYDKDGKAVLHEKRSTVTFDTPDGRYAVFKLSHIADSRS